MARCELSDPLSRTARRVAVFGVTGSGKSVLARATAERIGAVYVSVDDLAFEPCWQEVAADEQRRRAAAVTAGEAWVIDSVYGAWQAEVFDRIELIVGLDYPRWVSLSRLVRRTARRVLTGEPCCNGNRETLRRTFSKKSILVWHAVSFARKRDQIRAWAADPEVPPVLVLRSPRAAEAWFEALGGL